MAMDPVITLIQRDPELMHRLIDAGTREERAAILSGLGVAMPEAEHVKATMADLMAVSGGGSTTKVVGSAAGAAAGAA